MKKYAASLTNHFEIGAAGTHISTLTYSNSPGSLQSFSSSYEESKVKANIQALKSNGGTTNNMASMFQYARENVFNLKNFVRQGQPRVLVVFTYGNYPTADAAKAEEQARLLRTGEDVRIVIVNGGSKEQNSFLENLVSAPVRSTLINLENAADARDTDIRQRLSEEICAGL